MSAKNAAETSAPAADPLRLKLVDSEVANSSTEEALSRVSREWDKAEELMKLAERLRAEVVQPSVNELRYAGRRLVDAWKIVDQAAAGGAARESFNAFISDALFRCHCAQHDAIDASVLFVQRAVGEYEKEFGLVLLLRHFPAVAELRASLSAADELIVSSRSDRGRRADDYDRLAVEHLPTIVRVFRTISSNRKALEELVEEKVAQEAKEAAEKAKQSARFRWSQGTTVLAALAAAVVGAVLTLVFTNLNRDGVSSVADEPAAQAGFIDAPAP